MNSENLPQIVKENIFLKIKKWFLKIFKRNDIIINEGMDNIEKEEYIQVDNFKQDIQLGNINKILNLQEKLKNNRIKISELSNEDLDEIIKLYKNQIAEKKIKLKQYRIKIAQNN